MVRKELVIGVLAIVGLSMVTGALLFGGISEPTAQDAVNNSRTVEDVGFTAEEDLYVDISEDTSGYKTECTTRYSVTLNQPVTDCHNNWQETFIESVSHDGEQYNTSNGERLVVPYEGSGMYRFEFHTPEGSTNFNVGIARTSEGGSVRMVNGTADNEL